MALRKAARPLPRWALNGGREEEREGGREGGREGERDRGRHVVGTLSV